MCDLWQQRMNSGDDMAGIIHKVGANVMDLRPGDRVAGLHAPGAPHGSFAEYGVAEAHTTFIVPPSISFERECFPNLVGC